MKRIIMLITAIAVMFAGLFVASPAMGETITAEAHATSMDEVNVAATIKAATVVNTNAQGKIVGAWFKNPDAGNGRHWAPSKAKKVRFVTSYNKGAASCKPFRLKKGKWYPRTLVMRDGTPFQVKGGRRVSNAWALFDFGPNCQPRHRGFWNGKRWIGDCVNPKPQPDWPVVPPSMVVEVKQHTSIDYKLELDWRASAWVHGSVTVHCPRSSATASFKSKGEVAGSVTLKISARSRTEAEAEANRQIKLDVKNSISVKASIMGSGEVNAEGEAIASCTDDGEPPSEPPVFVQFREFNDLEVNWVDDHCVTVDTPAGHTATVYWEAKFGSFAIPTKQAQDGVQVCSDYKAPSEVPAGGTDTIKVRVVDNVTDKSVTQSTDPFIIHPTGGHPERSAK